MATEHDKEHEAIRIAQRELASRSAKLRDEQNAAIEARIVELRATREAKNAEVIALGAEMREIDLEVQALRLEIRR